MKRVPHGYTCPVVRDACTTGYLHDPLDDGVYIVDGVRYCGRCHRYYPIHPVGCLPPSFRNKLAEADENGCILWSGSRDLNGYGKFVYEGKVWYAHKFVWNAFYGDPGGKYVCHANHCKSVSCVRPEHLCLRKIPNGNGKLTPDQVRAIRLDTRKPIDCCNDYGVSPASIINVRSRKTWKDIS